MAITGNFNARVFGILKPGAVGSFDEAVINHDRQELRRLPPLMV